MVKVAAQPALTLDEPPDPRLVIPDAYRRLARNSIAQIRAERAGMAAGRRARIDVRAPRR